MNYLSKLKNEKTIALGICFLFWLIVYLNSGVITAGFILFDDHTIASSTAYLKDHNLFELISKVVSEDLKQRFTPGYFTFIALLTFIFRDNWALWHIYVGITAVFASYFLYLSGRNLGFNPFLAMLFCFFSFVGIHSVSWLRLHYAETIGIFLLALAMYFLSLKNQSKKTKTIFLILMFLMTLTKESFLAAVPAMLFLLNWLESRNTNKTFRQTVMSNMPVNISLAAVCILEILFIIIVIGTGKVGYAGVSLSSLSPVVLADVFNSLIIKSNLVLIITALAVFLPSILGYTILINKDMRFGKAICREILPVTLFAALLILPQLVLHAQSGWLTGRYLYPSSIGLSIVLISSLKLINSHINNLSRYAKTILFLLVGLVFSLTAFLQAKILISSANGYANLCRNTVSSLNFIKTQLDNNPNAKILLIAEPITNYEQSFAMNYFIEYMTGKKIGYIHPFNSFEGKRLKEFAIQYDNRFRNELFKKELADFAADPDVNKMDIIISFDNVAEVADKMLAENDRFIKKDFKYYIIYEKKQ